MDKSCHDLAAHTNQQYMHRTSLAPCLSGAIKEQIDRLVDKFFHDLAAQDEMLNFSVAITVMKVQRKWRTRMRAAKLRRKKQWRHDREDAPLYPELVHGKAIIVERWVSRSVLASLRPPMSAQYLWAMGFLELVHGKAHIVVRYARGVSFGSVRVDCGLSPGEALTH